LGHILLYTILIIGIATFSIGFLIPYVDAVSTVKVVLIEGKLVDMSQFSVTPHHSPNCFGIHLHPASGSSVTARDGTVIPDPAPTACGYGFVKGFKTGFVRDIPANQDKDRDGITDTFELEFTMTDPNNPCSDGETLDGDTDKDKDGLTVNEELVASTFPNNPDSNNNGIPDGLEVALSTTAKDWYKVPLLINILKDSEFLTDSPATTARVKQIVKDMNMVFMQAKIMFHLVEINKLADNDGEPPGPNNNGIVESRAEDDAIRDSGKTEIESKIQTTKKMKGKGMKITFVEEIKHPSPAGGSAIGGNPVVLMTDALDNPTNVLASLHEFMHALGLSGDKGHSERTPETDDDGPENPMSTHVHGYDFVRSTDPGKGIKGLKMTPTQITGMQDLAKQFGLPGTGGSPYFMKQWQGGAVVDPRGHQTRGIPSYLDITSINMESEVGDDLVSILITLGGLYPNSGVVDATYSLSFDTDNNQFTGFAVGSFSGIDQEVVIRVTGDASIEPLSATGIIFGNVNFLDTLLIPRPQIIERTLEQGFPFPVPNPLEIPTHHQISLDISKSQLGFSANDIPPTRRFYSL